MENDGTNKTPTGKALAMLDAFASVGVRAFNKTMMNIGGRNGEGFRGNRSIEEVRRTIAAIFRNRRTQQHNIIIRPLQRSPWLIQLDDLDITNRPRITPHAFMMIRTSAGKDGTGNYQAWVAVNDGAAGKETAEDFARGFARGPATPTGRQAEQPALPEVSISKPSTLLHFRASKSRIRTPDT